MRQNFVGVVCDKPWQAIQAARALKATWKEGPRLPPQTTFYDHMRREPARNTLVVDSGDVDAALAGAAAVVKATYLHPYQMHGSMGSSCAVADVRGDRATIWSSTQSAYPLRNTAAMLLKLPPERRAPRLHARIGLLRHQRRRYRRLRRGDSFASRWTAGPRAALATGRDGVGELRLCLRDRPARRAGRAGNDRRVGLRVVECFARRTSRLRHAGQRGHRHACWACRRRRSHRAPSRRRRRRSTTGATRHRRTSPGVRAGAVAAPAASRASACSRTRCDRRSSPDRCARRAACRTHSRTSRSWTRSRRR